MKLKPSIINSFNLSKFNGKIYFRITKFSGEVVRGASGNVQTFKHNFDSKNHFFRFDNFLKVVKSKHNKNISLVKLYYGYLY